MSDIFISYRREGGADRAHLAYNILTQAGYDVFMDIYGINDGEDFVRAFKDDVRNCNDYVLILSKNMFQTERENDYVLKEIKIATSENKNMILLSPDEDFWATEKPPRGFPDLDKKNYCYLPSNDQFKSILLSRNFTSKKKRTITYHSNRFGIGLEIKACNIFDQEGIRVVHCMDDFESDLEHIIERSVYGQLLLRCKKQGVPIDDCLKKQLARKDSNGQYDLPKRQTRHYPIGTTLKLSFNDEEYRIVAFNHWDEEEYISPYKVDEYRIFLKQLWKSLMREGKNSTINITLMGNNFTTFTGAQPDTEQKIWMILESLFEAARNGFRCDQLRICIGENDVEQIKFPDLKSILRYLDERQG